MNPINHQIRLAARATGLPVRSDWELTAEPVPAPGPGEFVVAVSHLYTRAPGGWSVAGDLTAVDVQDLTGDERR
jgi:hypothetical protein